MFGLSSRLLVQAALAREALLPLSDALRRAGVWQAVAKAGGRMARTSLHANHVACHNVVSPVF